eukprot:15364812-Ditylum_brightwellii.AAC.1
MAPMSERDGGKELTRTPIHYEGPKGKQIESVYSGVHRSSRDICQNGAVIVRRITHRETKIDYAVKIFQLKTLSGEGRRRLLEEISILCEVDHPSIIRLEEVYESENEVYLVQELCEGGDLYEWLTSPVVEEKKPCLWEQKCADILGQLLSGLTYLHSKGIIHRDLKLENILFESKDANSKIKIIDFGTLYTLPPEVIRKNYDERCDLWSIGVIAFILLGGIAPFGGCYGESDHKPIINNITHAHYEFEPAEAWACVSNEAKEFITKLLVTNASERPTAEEANKLPWLLNRTNQSTLLASLNQYK